MSASIGRAFAATGDPIRGETAVLKFTNSNLPPELLRQQAAHWIVNKQLLPEIRGLTLEEQTKFVDKVDQVCRDESFLPGFERFPSSFLQRHIRLSTPKA